MGCPSKCIIGGEKSNPIPSPSLGAGPIDTVDATALESPVILSVIGLEQLKSTPDCDCDSDSLSSMSNSLDDYSQSDSSTPTIETPSKAPRAIFPSYWKNEGSCPSRHANYATCPKTVIKAPQVSSHCMAWDEYSITYEQSLQQVEPAESKPFNRSRPYESPPLSWSKRWWEGWYGGSTPSLHTPYWNHGLLTSRGYKSESVLHTKPRRSCLRTSRFQSASGNCESHRKASGSVTFKAEVQIVRFSPPAETWAQKGWSRLFDNFQL